MFRLKAPSVWTGRHRRQAVALPGRRGQTRLARFQEADLGIVTLKPFSAVRARGPDSPNVRVTEKFSSGWEGTALQTGAAPRPAPGRPAAPGLAPVPRREADAAASGAAASGAGKTSVPTRSFPDIPGVSQA